MNKSRKIIIEPVKAPQIDLTAIARALAEKIKKEGVQNDREKV